MRLDSQAEREEVVLRVEPAALSEVPDLVTLRDALARWLLHRGIEQWNPGEVGVDRMGRWVAAGRVFVHRRGGAPVATVAVLCDDPDIWPADDAKAGYIHLLMVDRRFAGEGLGDAMLRWAERYIAEQGAVVARLDVVRTYEVLQQWYAERGYQLVGFRDFDSCWAETALREKRLDC